MEDSATILKPAAETQVSAPAAPAPGPKTFPAATPLHQAFESGRYPYARLMGRVTYETQKAKLQAELLKVHESSPGTRRSFCGVCGTKLFFQSEKWPGETHVPLAAFDEPVDRPPQGHAFWGEHASWLPTLATPPA